MTIKDVYNAECAHVKVDHRLYKKIVDMEAHFVNKKPEHIEFFGGTLLGVQTVRFTNEDRDRLFIDILEVDDSVLEEKVYDVRGPDGEYVVNREWNISSDIFNISSVWLLHAIEKSTFLDDNQKQEAKVRVCLYMMYKFLTSRLYRLFRYPADPEIAAATYAQLSRKFAVKQHGSYGATLRVMAENSISKTGIHGRTIEMMDDDIAVRNMLNDIQGRIRDILKNVYGEFLKVHQEGTRITKSSSLVETDGELIFKDKSKSLVNYTRYLKSIITDEGSFVRQEIVDVIAGVMHTMPPKLLLTSLSWASRNYGHTKEQTVERAVDLIAEHAFEYLSANKALVRASKLRGAYMSSRSSDPKLIEIRNLVGDIVFNATKSKNESVIAATRTGFMIYVIVRMFSMRHYTS